MTPILLCFGGVLYGDSMCLWSGPVEKHETRMGIVLTTHQFEVGDGSQLRFRHDIWCGDTAIKDKFSIFNKMAHRSETLVVELTEILGGSQQWKLSSVTAAHDWEVGICS